VRGIFLKLDLFGGVSFNSCLFLYLGRSFCSYVSHPTALSVKNSLSRKRHVAYQECLWGWGVYI
jgi:hypothetical protein